MVQTESSPPSRLSRIPTWVLALIVPVIAVVAVLVTVVATDGNDSTGVAAAAPGTITIKDFDYTPKPIDVQVGEKVTVTNADGTVHTVTAKDGSFDTGDLAGGKSASITVSKAGTFEYFCEIHDYMTGTLKAS